jgi:hypothetical protein
MIMGILSGIKIIYSLLLEFVSKQLSLFPFKPYTMNFFGTLCASLHELSFSFLYLPPDFASVL